MVLTSNFKRSAIAVNISLILYFCIVTLSCERNSVDYNFNKLVTIKENNYSEIFPSHDSFSIENSHNKYYIKLLTYGKNINGYLLGKAISDIDTNWYNYPFYFKMKEGDIAVMLLIEINEINFHWIIPDEIRNDYEINGARIWWEYLHNNRSIIIKLIEENM